MSHLGKDERIRNPVPAGLSRSSRTLSDGACTSSSPSSDFWSTAATSSSSSRPKSKKLEGKPHWDSGMGGYQLKVGSLGRNVEHRDLRMLFSQYGEVVNVYLPPLSDPSRLGVGYVSMKDVREAGKAGLALNGRVMDGHAIDIKWALKRAPLKRPTSSSRSPERKRRRSQSCSRTVSPGKPQSCSAARDPLTRRDDWSNGKRSGRKCSGRVERTTLGEELTYEMVSSPNSDTSSAAPVGVSILPGRSSSSVASTVQGSRFSLSDFPRDIPPEIRDMTEPVSLETDSPPPARTSFELPCGPPDLLQPAPVPGSSVTPGAAPLHLVVDNGEINAAADRDAARVKRLMEKAEISAEEAFVLYIKNRSLYEKLHLE